MDTSSTSIQQQLRKLEQLVTAERMTADDLRSVELGLKAIIDRIDAIQTMARDLHHTPELRDQDTKGLDKLEKALNESLKKDVGE